MTVAFKTFGCRLNRAEALEMEAKFLAGGHQIVDLDGGGVPDLIVVRGCSVTARAQRDCEKTIAHLQQKFPRSQIRITGCLPSAERFEAPPPFERPKDPAPIPMGMSRAYLKVQDGCNGACSFCIVPKFRGPSRSIPFHEVLIRARAFLAAGYRELVITGCNLALYHSEGRNFPALLDELAELDSDLSQNTGKHHRIRIGSLEPGINDRQILDVMERHPNICRFLHLSLQSGSDRVLKRMNRPYSIEGVTAFCTEAVRRLGPHLSLGADVIAGFPGETEEDHILTRDFLFSASPSNSDSSTFSFVNLHVFPYSERPGTPAASLSGSLPRAIRLNRAKDLETKGRRQRAAFARGFIGQTVEVCVEHGGDHGWTSEYLLCRFDGFAARRSLVTVVIDDVKDDVLVGHRT